MPPLISIPPGPAQLLRRLEAAGFEAYVVGGCVRDSLQGKTPFDWDLCTSARPDEMAACFAGLRVVPTGIKHGTLTVVLGGTGYEITTYRVETGYTDHRHPDGVSFVRSLKEDLARRDFTVNAMAWHPDRGLCDPFGGQQDLRRGLIRCVGRAATRFEEDALRILRALRFASQLNFTMEEETAGCVRSMAAALRSLPGERLGTELKKLLCGPGAGRVLWEFWPVFCEIIPALTPLTGAAQDNPHHCYSMDRHTVEAVAAAPAIAEVRLCMLFHDIAKPLCRTTDVNGIGHYKGHPALSARIAAQTLRTLRFDRATIERVCLLIRYHDERFSPDAPSVKRMLGLLGPQAYEQLLAVQRCDAQAKGNCVGTAEALERITAAQTQAERILQMGECYSLAGLAVRGEDLLASGVPAGPAVGSCLRRLLDAVVEGKLPNHREALLDWVRGQSRPPVSQQENC